MNKIVLLVLLFIIIVAQRVSAAASTPTPSASPTIKVTEAPKNQQVENLKERLATKVAELRQTEQRAVYGKVKSRTISTLTVETETKDVKIETADEVKVLQMIKGKRTTLTIEDVAKDDIVTVFGQYDTTVEVLKAKVIFIQSASTIVHKIGSIKETSKADYTITVEGTDGTSYVVDFETFTKTSLYSASDGLVKGGFSKLVPGDLVFVTGTAVPKKENRVSAMRILNLGNLTGVLPTPSPSPEATEKPTPKSSPTP